MKGKLWGDITSPNAIRWSARNLVLMAIGFFGLCAKTTLGQSPLVIGQTTCQVDTVATGLNVPWEILVQGDYLWMTERHGLVSRVHRVTKTKTVVLDLSTVIYHNPKAGCWAWLCIRPFR